MKLRVCQLSPFCREVDLHSEDGDGVAGLLHEAGRVQRGAEAGAGAALVRAGRTIAEGGVDRFGAAGAGAVVGHGRDGDEAGGEEHIEHCKGWYTIPKPMWDVPIPKNAKKGMPPMKQVNMMASIVYSTAEPPMPSTARCLFGIATPCCV